MMMADRYLEWWCCKYIGRGIGTYHCSIHGRLYCRCWMGSNSCDDFEDYREEFEKRLAKEKAIIEIFGEK